MKTFCFYFNDGYNNNSKVIIIKSADNEEQAKQKLITTYFKGLSGWNYDEVVDLLKNQDFCLTLVNELECLE